MMRSSVYVIRAAAVLFTALVVVLLQELRPAAQPSPETGYAGSAACRQCHQRAYDRWKDTLMANVVRDPTQYPNGIIPDLTARGG